MIERLKSSSHEKKRIARAGEIYYRETAKRRGIRSVREDIRH